MAFYKIISCFQAVSAHLIRQTLFLQCISLPGSSTFNANMNPGRGHILSLKYLASAWRTPAFVPCFCIHADGKSEAILSGFNKEKRRILITG